jgi:tetratricopeptide (TPR) repeat protein
MTSAVKPRVLLGALAFFSTRAALVFGGITGLALSAVPLLGLPGLESALVLGVLLPSFCAVIGARIARVRVNDRAPSSAAVLGSSVGAALIVLAMPVVLLTLNGLRVRNCEPLQGFAFIALGPLFGCVLAALWGALCGSLPVRAGMAVMLALLGPLGEIAFALYELYATPAVFSYGHFFGYFPGSLYDELITIPWPLIFLRMATALALLALSLMLISHRRPDTGALQRFALSGMWPVSTLAILAALAFLTSTAYRKQLGQATSRAHIVEALGGHHQSKRCELYVPREMRRSDVQRLADDCDFRVQQMERFFNVTQKDRIAVLAFRNAGEKKALMGAAATNIAKPWRGEIYIEAGEWPHSILAHELAHIVAGNIGMGPMRITGQFFGLVPDLALVEGVAVAAAWSSSAPGGLTPHQWTRAMLDLGIAPRLHDILGTGFLGQQKRLAYTYVGSLVRYIEDTDGPAAIRRIYMTGDIEAALSTTLDKLEAEWHEHLKLVPFPESAQALAAFRFSGGSVLSTVCPHTRAELKQELGGLLASADDHAARSMCRKVLEIDPSDASVRATLVALLSRAGDKAASDTELALIAANPGNVAVVAAAKQMLADEAFRRRDIEAARAAYRELLSAPQDRDALRQLQVKGLAMDATPRARQLIFDILIGEPGRGTDGASAVYFARELRGERNDGLAHYLEARQMYFQGRLAESVALHDDALRLGLPSPELEAEAVRLRAVALFALGKLADARAAFQALWDLNEKNPSLGYGTESADWLERIRFTQRGR